MEKKIKTNTRQTNEWKWRGDGETKEKQRQRRRQTAKVNWILNETKHLNLSSALSKQFRIFAISQSHKIMLKYTHIYHPHRSYTLEADLHVYAYNGIEWSTTNSDITRAQYLFTSAYWLVGLLFFFLLFVIRINFVCRTERRERERDWNRFPDWRKKNV